MLSVTDTELTDLCAQHDLVVVDLYADWCGPCKRMEPELVEAAELLPEVQFVKINIDDYPAIAKQFSVQSIPTNLIFSSGKLVGRLVGAKTSAAIVSEVTLHL